MSALARKLHKTRPSLLPVDYTRMVDEVFKTNFDAELKTILKAEKSKAHFTTSGSIYPDEVMICVSLIQEKKLSAISIYASCDFDSKASVPTVQDLLSAGVDAIGSLFSQLLDPKKPEALENANIEWSELQIENVRVWVRVDRANPEIDQQADDWLAKNDPEHLARLLEEEEEISELFVTGPRKSSN